MKTNLLVLLVMALAVVIAGCSSVDNSPLVPRDRSLPLSEDISSVIGFDGISGVGIFGAYSLSISPDGSSADLTPMRTSSLGESFIVSGMGFFTMNPCADCLKMDGLTFASADSITLHMSVKHPFQKGSTALPPSAVNRLDLDVFDLALVFNPLDQSPAVYPQTGVSAYTGIMLNADGYTRELESIAGHSSALPYKICYESSRNNRFEMGFGYKLFDMTIRPGSKLKFEMYLTMGYGASAKKMQRLNPVYYVPEFNRKAAWKVNVTPPDLANTWIAEDTTTEHDVTIDIYDWNHGATVATTFPDSLHTSYLSASSNVSSVSVEVLGMVNSLVNATTTDTSSNGWDNPLTYTATFANENGLPAGQYPGLVKVTDSRIPPSSGPLDFGYEWGFTWNTGLVLDHQKFESAVDPAGNVINAGEFMGTYDFNPGIGIDMRSSNPGNPDAYVKKFDSSGNYLWAVVFGGTGLEYVYGVSTDLSGNIFVTGKFAGTVDFDPGPGTDVHQAFSDMDIFLVKFNSNGTFQWGQTWGSTYEFNYVRDVTTDSAGNSYVVGEYRGWIDFDPGPFEDSYWSNGFEDIYLVKYNSNGVYQAVITLGGIGADSVSTVCVDNTGNIHVLGSFAATVDFDPGPGQTLLTSVHYPDSPFVVKFNSGGGLIWVQSWGSDPGWSTGNDMVIDGSGNVCVVGSFTSTVDFDPGPGSDAHSSVSGSYDSYFLKLSSGGSYMFAKRWGANQADFGVGIDVDESGNTYVTGGFMGTVDFDPGPNVVNHSAAGESDCYISKYDPTGIFIWAQTWGGGSMSWGSGVALDNSGNIFVTGAFRGSIDLDPSDLQAIFTATGTENRFLEKFVTSGIASKGQSDTLVHTPDGIDLWWRYIPEFATYQAFTATIN